MRFPILTIVIETAALGIVGAVIELEPMTDTPIIEDFNELRLDVRDSGVRADERGSDSAGGHSCGW